MVRVRFGYPRLTVLLKREGWPVGKKLVYRRVLDPRKARSERNPQAPLYHHDQRSEGPAGGAGEASAKLFSEVAR